MQETDAELITRARAGDSAAAGALWKRHFAVGLRVARSHAPGSDAEDIVAEAFARIIAALRRGSGPTELFRPYLYTVIRNIAMDEAKQRARFDGSGIDLDAFEAADDDGQRAVAADLDRSTLGRAFRSLPDRWQSILWYVDVEGVRPRQVAPIVGMQAGAVSSLAYRARRALRAAWVQEHVALASTADSCRAVLTQYGAYESGLLTPRKRHLFEEHVRSCPHCPTVVDEARNSSRAIAVVLIPLLTGGLTAKAVLGAKTVGASASATTLGAWGHRIAKTAAAHTKTVAIAGGSATVIAAGAIVSPLIAAPWHAGHAVPAAAIAVPQAVEGVPDLDAETSVQQSPQSASQRHTARAQPTSAPATTPSPVATPTTAPAAATASASPTATPTGTPTTKSHTAPASTPSKTSKPLETLAAPVPAETTVLSANRTVALSGTAKPGTTITATVAGTKAGTAVTNSDGSWSIALDLGADKTYAVTFTASESGYTTSESASTTVTVDTQSLAPTITSTTPSATIPEVAVTGTAEAGSTVHVTVAGSGATATTTADAKGAWSATLSGILMADTAIDVTATDPAGNISSTTSSPLTIAPTVTIVGGNVLSATISAQGWANSRVSIAIDSTTVATLTLDANGNLPNGAGLLARYAGYGALASGKHTVSITYLDANGNAVATPGTHSYTVETIG